MRLCLLAAVLSLVIAIHGKEDLSFWRTKYTKRGFVFVDSKGHRKIHKHFYHAFEFLEGCVSGVAGRKREGGWYLIDRKGEIISRKYDFLWAHCHNTYPFLFCLGISSNDTLRFGIVNERDSIIIPFIYKYIDCFNEEEIEHCLGCDQFETPHLECNRFENRRLVDYVYNDLYERMDTFVHIVPVRDTFDVWGRRIVNGRIEEEGAK